MRLLLTVEETAKALGISRSQVYVLIGEGRLSAVAIGRSRRVPVEAVEAFVKELRGADAVGPERTTPATPKRSLKAVRSRGR